MFQIIKPLSTMLKIKKISVSDLNFLLHTKLTVVLLVLFSVLLSTKEFFGTSIQCYQDEEPRRPFLNDFCWTSGTFIHPNVTGFLDVDYQLYTFGRPVAYDKRIYQRYYPWVVLVLMVQATLCYTPAFLWRIYERGLMSYLCEGLDYVFMNENVSVHKRKVIEYFKNKCTSSIHTVYVHQYYGFKLLSNLILILNMFMLDFVFPNYWESYGTAMRALYNGDLKEWTRHSNFVFPQLAKCMFHNYGPSGSIQSKDSLCVLPLNMFNSKVFTFVWVWFVFLAIVSIFDMLFILLLIMSKTIRLFVLKRKGSLTITLKQLRNVTNDGNLGDWFVLKQMSKNLNAVDFDNIITDLAAVKASKLQYELDKTREAVL